MDNSPRHDVSEEFQLRGSYGPVRQSRLFWKKTTRFRIWTPPALQAASSLLDSGSDCKQYIRPPDASVDAGPDEIRSQEPR